MSITKKILINHHDKLLEAFSGYRDFCRILTDGYALIASDMTLIDCNQEFCRMLEGKKKRLLKEGQVSNMFEVFLGEKQVALEDLLDINKPQRVDQVTMCVNGNKLLVVISYFPFFDNGIYLGSLAIFRNMTDESILQYKYKDKYLEAMTDPLTELKNRSYFMQELERLTELYFEDKQNNYFSVVLLDIDYFKKVNDTYGHQAGDAVLVEVAKSLRKNVFESDIVGRYGGEEFVILFPNVNLNDAMRICERLRRKLESKTITHDSKKIKITASFGVTQISGNSDKANLMLERADTALYEAKDAGRNQVKSK